MPLNFGKLGAAIALITVAAFIGWLLFTSFFASETVEERCRNADRACPIYQS